MNRNPTSSSSSTASDDQIVRVECICVKLCDFKLVHLFSSGVPLLFKASFFDSGGRITLIIVPVMISAGTWYWGLRSAQCFEPVAVASEHCK